MEQLLTNLLSNAARHAPGTAITISVESVGDRARLRVADRGPGIARRDQARIFEAFRSLDQQPQGLGLGLYIVRQITVAHGGTIRVESELGHGAIFVVELPRQPLPPPRALVHIPLRARPVST
jgi:signal transduction histidine kinase